MRIRPTALRLRSSWLDQEAMESAQRHKSTIYLSKHMFSRRCSAAMTCACLTFNYRHQTLWTARHLLCWGKVTIYSWDVFARWRTSAVAYLHSHLLGLFRWPVTTLPIERLCSAVRLCPGLIGAALS